MEFPYLSDYEREYFFGFLTLLKRRAYENYSGRKGENWREVRDLVVLLLDYIYGEAECRNDEMTMLYATTILKRVESFKKDKE